MSGIPDGAAYPWSLAKFLRERTLFCYEPYTIRWFDKHWWIVDGDGYYWARSHSKAACKRTIEKFELQVAKAIMVQGTAAEGM